jgi:ParB family transcriptional regulator, chromosome partitioning protein
VRASDKRARFVGIDPYEAAGGDVLRDLFQQDDGGWLQNPVLLERLVAEKLEHEAVAIRSQNWKWVEIALDFPYGLTFGLRQISGEPVAMTDEEVATAEALRGEYERLEQDHAKADELPEEIDQRLGEIETALAALDDRPLKYDPDEVARAGVFISIDGSGELRIERGYIRPEDEPAIPEAQSDAESNSIESVSRDVAEASNVSSPSPEEREEDQEQGIKPIDFRIGVRAGLDVFLHGSMCSAAMCSETSLISISVPQKQRSRGSGPRDPCSFRARQRGAQAVRRDRTLQCRGGAAARGWRRG